MKKIKGDIKSFVLDDEIYSKEAVGLAAYIYSERVDIKQKRQTGKIEVILSGFDSADRNIEDDFINEILNQQCRIDLAGKNSRISKIIVTKALLSAAGERGEV